ncbi:regulatory protein GemA [Sinirhodobacter populi]|uniref:Regulatory protein GemA n=1 Tax=Paenirhodobacter populi TaxID=2306993 RepID=A0A443K7L1_9RHOB|nr:regulatory protein GemA [Sinirhodobacter populi]RWR28722.1 regulatory protein GemA [Sinirhodobacter populi]
MNHTAIINIAKGQLGMDEDAYRMMLVRVTGVASLRSMSDRQKIDVIDELKRMGFRVKSGGHSLPKAFAPHSRQIHALWNSCYRLGVIQNKSREALRAFCKRFVAHGQDAVAVDPDLLSREQAKPVIAALKAMEQRGMAQERVQ